jgi:hypothetical protein
VVGIGYLARTLDACYSYSSKERFRYELEIGDYEELISHGLISREHLVKLDRCRADIEDCLANGSHVCC